MEVSVRGGEAARLKQCKLDVSGCGAAWLARLLGVQEVPGSNPGSPTKPFNQIREIATGSRERLQALRT